MWGLTKAKGEGINLASRRIGYSPRVTRQGLRRTYNTIRFWSKFGRSKFSEDVPSVSKP
jgi:hypothetical protein